MIRSLLLCVLFAGASPVLRAQEPTASPAAADATPAPPPPVVQATAVEEIRALVGKTATVEGKVTRIGSTTAGGITFINFAGGPNGFVAVVFKADYPTFPEGFDKYKEQTLRVTGPVVLFKETTPQIVLKKPEQIAIVAPPAEASPTPASTPAN